MYDQNNQFCCRTVLKFGIIDPTYVTNQYYNPQSENKIIIF